MGRKSQNIRLQVLLNARRVGVLEKTRTGALYFQYSNDWLTSNAPMPISSSLPLQESQYSGGVVEAYFENLLPEGGELRRKIASRMGAQSADAFDLLSVIGRDCVGAVQLIPEQDDLPAGVPVVEGRTLTDNEIEAILKNLSRFPLGINKEFRISVAGMQEKTALLNWNGRWHMPAGSVPTTHIFKMPMGVLQNGIDMSESVENEWICLKICKALKLDVANAEIERFGDTKCLIVERFDRKWSKDGKYLYRLPMEDLCQAFGISSVQKYEVDRGPGILAILKFLNSSNERERDRLEFLRAQIVFQILGATDGHAKNFSIFMGPGGIKLTPLYDILTVFPAMSRRQIEKKDVKLAMAVGDSRKWQISRILRRHWLQTAQSALIPLDETEKMIDEVVSLSDSLDVKAIGLPSEFSPLMVEQILEGIHSVTQILKLDS